MIMSNMINTEQFFTQDLNVLNQQQDDMLKAGVIIFKGQQVTTISGTANFLNVANATVNNAFTNNKAKFILNDWYFEITAQEREELRKTYPQIGTNTRYLFTEKGFRMLCMLSRSEASNVVVQDTINKASEVDLKKYYLELAEKTLERAPEHYPFILELLKQHQDHLSICEKNRHEEYLQMLRANLQEIEIKERYEKERLLLTAKQSGQNEQNEPKKCRWDKFKKGQSLVLIKGKMIENGEITFESISEASKYLGVRTGTVASVALYSKSRFYSPLEVYIQYIHKDEYLQQKAG